MFMGNDYESYAQALLDAGNDVASLHTVVTVAKHTTIAFVTVREDAPSKVVVKYKGVAIATLYDNGKILLDCTGMSYQVQSRLNLLLRKKRKRIIMRSERWYIEDTASGTKQELANHVYV